jgi:biotin carboxylase
MFGEAAEKLGVRLVFATDRCDQLDDPWWDGAIPVRFHQERPAVEAILAAACTAPLAGVVAVGDRPTVVAARVARALGLPGHPPLAATLARDKRLTRAQFRDAGLLVPWFRVVPRTLDPRTIAPELSWPLVVKPTVLSGSRGVIRANLAAEFIAAFERVRRLLDAPDIRMLQDPAADEILIEQFIDGAEYAVEGVLQHGALRTLAIFDKPDPLDGPYFEETLYITPSRAHAAVRKAIVAAVATAAQALGLSYGPIHAECRVNARGVFVLEVAARPIGGLCAQALRFTGPNSAIIGLEELLLRHAMGEDIDPWHREREASGVMMIPIPCEGIFRRVAGVDEALRVEGVRDVRITAKADQRLVPLPEGASYLGFIFAREERPAAVERALRAAHERLSFVIDRAIAVTPSRNAGPALRDD